MNKDSKQKVLCACENCLIKSSGVGIYVHISTKYRHQHKKNLCKKMKVAQVLNLYQVQ